MVYYLGIQPTQTGRSLKNELDSFTLLHNFLTWHNLSNVLRFMLHVLILLIDFIWYNVQVCARNLFWFYTGK